MTDPVEGRLADLTTFRLGGPARSFSAPVDTDELIFSVRQKDELGEPLLLLGGGSNVVIADSGFDGHVIHVKTQGIRVESQDDCSGATVRVAAGEHWDSFVQRAITEGWVGVEALSGIPGLVGAAPIQNIGAYGAELAQVLAQVVVWDRVASARRTLALADCGFGYRTSVFKRTPGRYVVLEVVLQMRLGTLGAPVAYAELARRLGVSQGERAKLAEVREAVLALRGGKGMVLDPSDHDTWSAGSFFTNPIIPSSVADALPSEAPRWPVVSTDAGDSSDLVKTSAAWLIEHAGFSKGYGTGSGSGSVSLSTKHTLALTNRGNATTAELLDLAHEIRDGVHKAFGIELEPEPVLINCSL